MSPAPAGDRRERNRSLRRRPILFTSAAVMIAAAVVAAVLIGTGNGPSEPTTIAGFGFDSPMGRCITGADQGIGLLFNAQLHGTAALNTATLQLTTQYGESSPTFKAILAVFGQFNTTAFQHGLQAAVREGSRAVVSACESELGTVAPSTTTQSATVPATAPLLDPSSFETNVKEAPEVAYLSKYFGSPTSRFTAQCGVEIGELNIFEWGDLTVEFNEQSGFDIFVGYLYNLGGWNSAEDPPRLTPNNSASPQIATVDGITLGSTVSQLTRSYPSVSPQAPAISTVKLPIGDVSWQLESLTITFEAITSGTAGTASIVQFQQGEPVAGCQRVGS
jgi:hypothetical protein